MWVIYQKTKKDPTRIASQITKDIPIRTNIISLDLSPCNVIGLRLSSFMHIPFKRGCTYEIYGQTDGQCDSYIPHKIVFAGL